MAIYMEYDKKLEEVMRQIAVMSAYGAGETIAWTNNSNSLGGTCNIKEYGAGVMWEWEWFDYKIAGDENYENN